MVMADGLEGVVAASTRLSCVDGEAGRLTLAGYAVEDLAPSATFEEVAYLFLNGRLPSASERGRFARDLAVRRTLPSAAIAVLREAAAAKTPPMDALRMAASLLSLGRQEDPLDDAMTVIAASPTIVGTYWRARHGLAPSRIRVDLPHAAYSPSQLFGDEPSAERARALETYLNTPDHGLNASTFAARVIISTHSDLISAVTGAIGALKGPLHGGAPGPAAASTCSKLSRINVARPTHAARARSGRLSALTSASPSASAIADATNAGSRIEANGKARNRREFLLGEPRRLAERFELQPE
jgi:citrate synthase